jgi:hypothetical protein
MNPQIYTRTLLFVLIACSHAVLANDGQADPFMSNGFKASVKTFNAMNEINAGAKVCACQILNLRSNNQYLENAVVFAESTSLNGQTDFEQASIRLEKEKRHLRMLFFNKISVVAKTSAATDCNTLFLQLKKRNDRLIKYEVLNADVVVR